MFGKNKQNKQQEKAMPKKNAKPQPNKQANAQDAAAIKARMDAKAENQECPFC